MRHDFTEKEAESILKRAIEMQAKGGLEKAGPPENSVSLDQLCQSAKEIGVDPELVRRAAAELSVQRTHPERAADTSTLEREFPEIITESDFPSLLDHLRSGSKMPGTAHVIGGTLEWQSYNPLKREQIHVTVTPLAGSTTVKVRCSDPLSNFPAARRVVMLPVLVVLFLFFAVIVPGMTSGFRYIGVFDLLIPLIIGGAVALSFGFLYRKGFPFGKRGEPDPDQVMQRISLWMDARRG